MVERKRDRERERERERGGGKIETKLQKKNNGHRESKWFW